MQLQDQFMSLKLYHIQNENVADYYIRIKNFYQCAVLTLLLISNVSLLVFDCPTKQMITRSSRKS